jgi:excisionase family DNA binding protein
VTKPRRTLDPKAVYLRPRQVAQRFGVSKSVVLRAIREGDLPAFRFGTKCVLLHPADVETWASAQLTPWAPR